eukprot:6088306-Alexandrium_andersonii.AAC.1
MCVLECVVLSQRGRCDGFGRSELELLGPRNNLKVGPGSSRGVHSAPFCALSPMATTAPPAAETRR